MGDSSSFGLYCIMINGKPFEVFEVYSNMEMLIIYTDNKILYQNYERISSMLVTQLVLNG